MLIVEMIAKIRRAFFVQGKPIKAIGRELRISRKVVRKVLRSEATEFRYEREAQSLPKYGPWRDKLDQLLLANEGKASRERLTLIRLFEELRGLGYDGGYDAVRRYAREWNKERGGSALGNIEHPHPRLEGHYPEHPKVGLGVCPFRFVRIIPMPQRPWVHVLLAAQVAADQLIHARPQVL
jgi:hypothetical protein